MFEIISVSIIILFLIISLYREWFQPAICFLIAVLALSFLHILPFSKINILPSEEILQGFANKEIASILLLIVFGNLLGQSSLFEILFNKAFEQTKTYSRFLIRLLPSVTGLSAFMNNTPIVALLIPYVYRWGKTNNIAISKLLIPLSFAAILGGTITLVGTSTNMLVNAYAITESCVEFSIFDFAWVGIPVSIIGLVYIIIFGKKYLPIRQTFSDRFREDSREYLIEVFVPKTSRFVGKSIRESNLRELNGLFVVEIIRESGSITPVRPTDVLNAGDTLILAGNVEAVTDLVDSNPDLHLPKFSNLAEQNFDLVEVVVAQGSYLANRQLKKSDFRSRYNAALVAINRRGQQLKGQLGEKILRTGDTLLIFTGQDFENSVAAKKDFYSISKLREIRSLNNRQSLLIAGGLFLAIILSALKLIPLFNGLLLLLLISILTRTLDFRKLHLFMDYNLLVIAALALSLGVAIDRSGLSELVANTIVFMSGSFGILGALVGIYLLTFILTELMTNIAAASLALPFGLAVAQALGISPEPFFLAIAYAASASFITPIGYQTNLMIYGPGGYKFKDFLNFGLPLTILYFICTIAILYWQFVV